MRDDVHCRLNARAAKRGMTVSDYLLADPERSTPDEIKERLGRLPPLKLSESPSVTLRRMRDAQG